MSASSQEDSETPVWRLTPASIAAMPSHDVTAPGTASPSPELFLSPSWGREMWAVLMDALSNAWCCHLAGTGHLLLSPVFHPAWGWRGRDVTAAPWLGQISWSFFSWACRERTSGQQGRMFLGTLSSALSMSQPEPEILCPGDLLC